MSTNHKFQKHTGIIDIQIGVRSRCICIRFFPHWVKALAPDAVGLFPHVSSGIRSCWFHFAFPLSSVLSLCSAAMDHAQGRSFHHHLARAIMHLNYLAGLLPFFEPSIEFDDGIPQPLAHGESSSHRGLHTFVPLPVASNPPTMVSHGGLPSRLISNRQPQTDYSIHHSPTGVYHWKPGTFCLSPQRSSIPHTAPVLSDPGADPFPEPRPLSDLPSIPTRTTIPVPVRSKQRTRMVDDPQPKKKHKAEATPASAAPAPSRPENPSHLPMEDDSDDSDAGESHRAASVRSLKGKGHKTPTPASIVTTATTPTIILTPNPHEMAPPPDLNDGRRESMSIHSPGAGALPNPLSRAWTESDDRQLTAMKEDTRSRPSWKSIGARLGRDPQLCKVRWSLLKRADQEGRINAPTEPETEDWPQYWEK